MIYKNIIYFARFLIRQFLFLLTISLLLIIENINSRNPIFANQYLSELNNILYSKSVQTTEIRASLHLLTRFR